MNPYHHYVSEYVRLLKEGREYPLGEFRPAARKPLAVDAPKALFFAPHPDDESIIGGLALRMLREGSYQVFNVAVTQGSKKQRQAERFKELEGACNYLGFELIGIEPNGLERVNVITRSQDADYWSKSVKIIADILMEHEPRVILFPHEHDWNSTHIGVHFLVMDALKQMRAGYECYLVETEFWGQMTDPNLMVELSPEDLGELMTATSFHVGEVKRNPYHLLLPAWLMDNVRRGAELVGGQGGAAPQFMFAALYRLRKWSGGKAAKLFEGGKLLSCAENPAELFPT